MLPGSCSSTFPVKPRPGASHTYQQSRKYLPDTPTGQSGGGKSSIEVPLAGHVKLASKTNHRGRKPLCSQMTLSVGGHAPALPLCVPGQLCPAGSPLPSVQCLCSSHSSPGGLPGVPAFVLQCSTGTSLVRPVRSQFNDTIDCSACLLVPGHLFPSGNLEAFSLLKARLPLLVCLPACLCAHTHATPLLPFIHYLCFIFLSSTWYPPNKLFVYCLSLANGLRAPRT